MLDKPNVVIPLASSSNQRGIIAYTNVITNNIDQRKVNSIYEPVQNAMTGKTTLYLSKRPGVEDTGNSYGVTGQVAYLCTYAAGATSPIDTNAWVFSTLNSPEDVRVSSSSTTTTIFTSANYFPQYVSHTSISGTDTVVLQSRNSSSGAQRVFYASAIGSWTEITDSTFTALTVLGKMEFMDGWSFTFDAPTQRIYNSDINSLSAWGDSNYITKQIRQDYGTGLAKFGKQILAFGQSSFEVFTNNGNPTGSPLITSSAHDVGLVIGSATATGHYYTVLQGKLYFVGRIGNARRSLGLFCWDGQRWEKIGGTTFDKILTSLPFSTSGNVYSVNSVSFYGQYAVSILLADPTNATGRSFLFFPAWNEWFEWSSTVFRTINNGTQYLGIGANAHKLYTIEGQTVADNYQDAGVDYTWQHTFQLPDKGNDRKFMPYMALKGDTARSAQSISVQFSDDDYQNFSTARTIDMTKPQKALYRCGSYEGARVVRLTHIGNTNVRLSQFLARIE